MKLLQNTDDIKLRTFSDQKYYKTLVGGLKFESELHTRYVTAVKRVYIS